MKKSYIIKASSLFFLGMLFSSLIPYTSHNITPYNIIILLFLGFIVPYIGMLWILKKTANTDYWNILWFLQILHCQNKLKNAKDIISIERTNSLDSYGEYLITVQEKDDVIAYTYPKYASWVSLKELWIFCAFLGGVIIYILYPEANQSISKVVYILPALILFVLFESPLILKVQKKYLPKDLRQKGISIVNIIRNDHADMTTLYTGEYSKKNEYFSCSWDESPSCSDGSSKQKID